MSNDIQYEWISKEEFTSIWHARVTIPDSRVEKKTINSFVKRLNSAVADSLKAKGIVHSPEALSDTSSVATTCLEVDGKLYSLELVKDIIRANSVHQS